MRSNPGLAGPRELLAVSAGGPEPVTCCRLRARPADFLVCGGGGGQAPGSRSSAGPAHNAHSGVPSPHPEPRGRARPRPRPPACTDPRSRRPRAEAHALTYLVRHPRPLVTAPRSSGTSQWPSPGTARKAAPGVPGAEGAVRGPAPRPVRACPARYRCGQPNPEARPRRGSPPALTIYSQALGSEAAAPRACADTAPPR